MRIDLDQIQIRNANFLNNYLMSINGKENFREKVWKILKRIYVRSKNFNPEDTKRNIRLLNQIASNWKWNVQIIFM